MNVVESSTDNDAANRVVGPVDSYCSEAPENLVLHDITSAKQSTEFVHKDDNLAPVPDTEQKIIQKTTRVGYGF
jgi:hypothetical protein